MKCSFASLSSQLSFLLIAVLALSSCQNPLDGTLKQTTLDGAFRPRFSGGVSAPGSLAAVAGNASVALSWSAPVGSFGSLIYNVYRDLLPGGSFTGLVCSAVSRTSCSDLSVSNGTTYYYVVTATGTGATSPRSSVSHAASPFATPSAPAALLATPGVASVALSWTAPAGAGAVTYTIKRGTATGVYGTTLASAQSGTAYTDATSANGTPYFYTVTATGVGGTSGNATEASATPYSTPSAPTGLLATAGNASVSLSWTAPGGTFGTLTYNVYRGTASGGPFSVHVCTAVSGTSCTDSSVTNATTYYYVATATGTGGSSGNSIASSGATPYLSPTAPTLLSGTAGNASVLLSWTAPSGTFGILTYNVYRGTASGGPFGTHVCTAVSTTSCADLTALNTTTYYYVATATGTGGTSGNSSASAGVTPFSTPGAPTGLGAAAGNASVALTWTAPAGSYGTLTYSVFRGTTASSETSLMTGISGTSWNDNATNDAGSTPVNNITYFYVVKAAGVGGTSGTSNEVNAVPILPFTADFPFNPITPAPTSTYANGANTDFTGGVVRLKPSSQTDNSNNCMTGFGDGVTPGCGGTFTGGAFFDPDTTHNTYGPYVRLSLASPNLELDSSWTPAWGNLVGYWKLNEAGGSGTVIDSSGHGLSGNVTSTILGTTGVLGTAATFDGTSSSVDLGNSANLQIIGKITIAAWVNVSTFPNMGYIETILGKGYDGGNEGYYLRLTNPSGTNTIEVGSYGGSGGSTAVAIPLWTTNTWHHVMGLFDGTRWSLYIDGQKQSSTVAGSGALSTTENVFIGSTYTLGQGGLGRYFNGTLDDVALWNTGLSDSAITTIYQHQSAKYAGTLTSRVLDGLATGQSWTSLAWTPTLPFLKELPDAGTSESQASYASQSTSLMSGIVGLWHLDEPAGASGTASVKDGSGAGNHGTPNGSVIFGKSGKLGQAGNFSNAYVIIPDAPGLELTTVLSMQAWVDPSSSNDGSYHAIISKSSGSGSYKLYIKTDGTVGVFNGRTNAFSVSGTTAIQANTWNHIVATFDGSRAKIFINGKLDASVIYSSSFGGTAESIRLGMDYSGGQYYSGLLDEVAIWSRALTDGTGGSPNEILELYRRGANRIRYQVMSCSDSACTTGSPSWLGPDGTNQTYFSELNNTVSNSLSGAVQAALPTMTFANFGAPFTTNLTNNRYFQYRAIMESDDANNLCNYGGVAAPCSPELSSVTVGPTHYDSSIPTVTNLTGVGYHSLTGLTETLGSNGCAGGTRYELSPDGSTWYYYTAGAWAIADGTYAKASAASVITGAVMNSFASQVGTGSIYFKAFLKSDGTHACEIDDFSITGNQ